MTAIERYLNDLKTAKRLAIDRFGNLTSLEKSVVEGSFEWMLDNLSFKRGQVQVDEDFTSQMNDFVTAVVDIINNNKGYQDKLSDYLQDVKTIGSNITKFQEDFNGFDPEKAGIKPLQKNLVTNIIDQFTENGLNSYFAQPLKDGLYRNVLAGMNQRQAKQYLQNYVISGKDESGKLAKYIEQTSIQAVSSYTGAINQKIGQTFDTSGFLIDGSIIDTSSPQCVKMVELANKQGGYLSNDQMQDIIDYAKDVKSSGLIPGTNLDNLPVNLLHFGCRHSFSPTIKPSDD